MADKALPCPTVLRQRLRYEPETGKLFWREAKEYMFPDNRKLSPQHRCATWNAKYQGKEAFTATCYGYKTGKVSGVKMMAHRVVWAVCHGAWPVDMIDHINRNRSDNRIANLREADAMLNASNQKYFADNPHVTVGVQLEKRRSRWRAAINVAGHSIKLGYFRTEPEAIAARKAAEKVLRVQSDLKSHPEPRTKGYE